MNKAQIHPTAVIYANVVIEDGAYIGPFCVIGAPPEIKGFTGSGKGVVISAGARLEKCVVVDSGAYARTMIGENNMLMSGVHIGHDAFLEPNVTIAPHAVVGGHCRICEGAYIGMNAGIHQHQVIGAFCAIGGNSFVPRRSFKALIQPGQTWAGIPAKYIGENEVGIQRAGIDAEMLIQLHQMYLDKYPMRHED